MSPRTWSRTPSVAREPEAAENGYGAAGPSAHGRVERARPTGADPLDLLSVALRCSASIPQADGYTRALARAPLLRLSGSDAARLRGLSAGACTRQQR